MLTIKIISDMRMQLCIILSVGALVGMMNFRECAETMGDVDSVMLQNKKFALLASTFPTLDPTWYSEWHIRFREWDSYVPSEIFDNFSVLHGYRGKHQSFCRDKDFAGYCVSLPTTTLNTCNNADDFYAGMDIMLARQSRVLRFTETVRSFQRHRNPREKEYDGNDPALEDDALLGVVPNYATIKISPNCS